MQLMDHNLIVPSGAIVVDNSLMKVGLASFFCYACKGALQVSQNWQALPTLLKTAMLDMMPRAGVQGRTYCSAGVKDELADAIREFNQYVRQDSRVDVMAIPFRDGVSIITRRYYLLPSALAYSLTSTLPALVF